MEIKLSFKKYCQVPIRTQQYCMNIIVLMYTGVSTDDHEQLRNTSSCVIFLCIDLWLLWLWH